MKINRIILAQTGTYDDQYMRPWDTPQIDGYKLSRLQERTLYGSDYSTGALAEISGEIIRPSATVSRLADVDRGWDTPRLFFMMEVEFPGTAGMSLVEYVTGYTDDVGVSNMRGDNHLSFDPNMRLYFNNIVRARRSPMRRSFGNTSSTVCSDAHQLILGKYTPKIDSLAETPVLMRVTDVFSATSLNTVSDLLGEEVLDIRPTHGPDRLASNNRDNGISSRYLSKLLTTFRDAADGDEPDDASMRSEMASIVREPSMSSMRTLQNLSLASELRVGGFVTWDEMLATDASLEDRAIVVLPQSRHHAQALHVRGQTSHWHGNDTTSVIAAMMIQAVPGLMMRLLLTGLDFSATNRTVDGQWDVFVNGFESFTDDMGEQHINQFIHKLTTDLLPGITVNNQLPLEIHARFDIIGQTFMEISVDGEPMVPFTAPSFADGLYSSVRAPNRHTLDNFANGLDRLLTNLGSDSDSIARAEPRGMVYNPFDNDNSNTGRRSNERTGSL